MNSSSGSRSLSSADRARSTFKLFTKAFSTLEEAVKAPEDTLFVEEAVIQRFEYTYELSWKCLKWVLASMGVELEFPKEIFKRAVSVGWIVDIEAWENMIESRNRMSHTYSFKGSRDVYKEIKSVFYPQIQDLLKTLGGIVDEL